MAPDMTAVMPHPNRRPRIRLGRPRHDPECRPVGPEARDLADTSFYETLVRVHRAGEGAPYTGLKPAAMPAAHAH